MFGQLYDIERLCTRIPGSITQIVLIDPADLATQPVWYDVPNIDALDFKPGKDVYRFDCDRQNSRLVDKPNTSSAPGDFFDYTLTCTIRGIRPEVDLLRKRLMNRRVHVVATYADGYQRFLPWVRLQAESDSGERRASRNQYSFTGTTRLAGIAPSVDATLTPPSSGGGGGTSDMDVITINTSGSTSSYEIPAGTLLDSIVVISTLSGTIDIGTSVAGTEITEGLSITANEGTPLGAALYYAAVDTTIYFTGLTGSTTIKLYLM